MELDILQALLMHVSSSATRASLAPSTADAVCPRKYPTRLLRTVRAWKGPRHAQAQLIDDMRTHLDPAAASSSAIDARDYKGRTALFNLVRTRQNQAACYLLAQGADPLAENNGGTSPLALAAMGCSGEQGVGTLAFIDAALTRLRAVGRSGDVGRVILTPPMSSPSKKGLHDRTHTHHKSPRLDTPKKGGAGGKGTWGKEGSEIEGAVAESFQDPNYDSEDDGFVPRPPPAIELFKQRVRGLLDEYFVSGVAEEAMRALVEIDRPEFHHELVKAVISRAMDLHDRERELASNLLPYLYPNVITHNKIVEGFTTLLERIEDLKLDIPSAPEYLSMFLARAVVDDLLPPAFLSSDSADVELAKETLVKAKTMIQGKGAFKRIAHIWGPGGDQSVKRFKERAQSILEEYLVSTDFVETDKQVRELNVASFHWYLVKKAVLLALDSKENDVDKVVKLLTAFSTSQLISEAHFVAGFQSCVGMIEDIEIDTPRGRELLSQFVTRGINAGFLPASFKAQYDSSIAALGNKDAPKAQ